MRKVWILATVAILLNACGSNKNTYVEEKQLLPDEPTNGTTLIVTAEGESNAAIGYTEVGDGSILVNCGDNCAVYVGSLIDKTENDAGNDANSTPVIR